MPNAIVGAIRCKLTSVVQLDWEKKCMDPLKGKRGVAKCGEKNQYLSSNESVLSTIISFQIYMQKNAILEKNFEEIFAALPLAQISSKFFH